MFVASSGFKVRRRSCTHSFLEAETAASISPAYSREAPEERDTGELCGGPSELIRDAAVRVEAQMCFLSVVERFTCSSADGDGSFHRGGSTPNGRHICPA